MAQKISVIGAGGWGTALAVLLNGNGHDVSLYEFFKEYANVLSSKRENIKFLRGIKIPETVKITNDILAAATKQDVIVLAVPSKFINGILDVMKKVNIDKETIILSVIKGIDTQNLKRISEIIGDQLNRKGQIAVLSGPSLADEVAKKIPTAVIIASKNNKDASLLQSMFSNEYFRVYTSNDVIGVELGGALKNIIALSKGILDGMGLGDNTKAALLTRGMAEMKRLAIKMGAKPQTLNGLSGFGDLVVTCIAEHSRNRSVGERIGRGEKLDKIIGSMEMVAEGVTTTKACYELAKRLKVDMPIVTEAYGVLFDNKDPKKAVYELMTRKLKYEEIF